MLSFRIADSEKTYPNGGPNYWRLAVMEAFRRFYYGSAPRRSAAGRTGDRMEAYASEGV
jgi:hypothetical protein